MTDTEVCRKAVSTWGVDNQLDQAIEECAELICAIRHHRRGRSCSLVEEIADVEIMISQMRLIFGAGVIDAVKKAKLARLAEKLEEQPC